MSLMRSSEHRRLTGTVGAKGYLALALLLYIGVRRSDVVLLGRQHRRMVKNEDTGARLPWFKFIQTRIATATRWRSTSHPAVIEQLGPCRHWRFQGDVPISVRQQLGLVHASQLEKEFGALSRSLAATP